MVVAYIDAHRDRFGVEPICRVLRDAGVQITPSTYYAHRHRDPSARAVRDAELTEQITTVHRDNLGVYGARKIHAELKRKGVPVARCTVERLMRAAGLRGIPREKTRKTTLSEGAHAPPPADLVERRFAADAPNRLWVADI
ncbi:IS3 family transposase [Kocuria sp. M1R5S2]|uniref:IS3 family transposase n=1 Tax=Kocuria rhizosphaerae TaxID=3376285 RepID=UPI003795210B